MRRIAINVCAFLVVVSGGLYLQAGASATEVDVVQACCYSACMNHCMKNGTFLGCHGTCNRDCQAC